jgi:hypothetical protein
MPDSYTSGSTLTTTVGFINRNNQRVHGHRGMSGNDHVAYSYKLECLHSGCGEVYGANGTDIFQRKCPRCQGGKPGIPF